MTENNKIRIGITQGDPNGVGYEVILKTLEDNRLLEFCTPILYGSGKLVAHYRKLLNLPQINFQTLQSADDPIKEGAYGLVNVTPEEFSAEAGSDSAEAGKEAFKALDAATADVIEGKIKALVTAPINKHNIHSEEFAFPGHTEYLASRADASGKELMILASDRLKVALATTHVPVAEVAAGISSESLLKQLKTLNATLISDFGIVRPRIAVLGLNPHSGDNGIIGTEEQEIIIPAIQEAQKQKLQVYGPYAADGFFGSALHTRFDAVFAMYHDQGLIPFKTIAMDSGVNFTAGLPFVRTSPDHGTAFDIAGKGEASEESFRQAIYMAIDVVRNRARYAEATRNPLRKQYFDKGKDNVVLDLK